MPHPKVKNAFITAEQPPPVRTRKLLQDPDKADTESPQSHFSRASGHTAGAHRYGERHGLCGHGKRQPLGGTAARRPGRCWHETMEISPPSTLQPPAGPEAHTHQLALALPGIRQGVPVTARARPGPAARQDHHPHAISRHPRGAGRTGHCEQQGATNHATEEFERAATVPA